MKISASLEGLGPNFKLNIIFNNIGKKSIYGEVLILDFYRKNILLKKKIFNFLLLCQTSLLIILYHLEILVKMVQVEI